MHQIKSEAIEGLEVNLDRLEYTYDPLNLSMETPHAFTYFLTISNLTDREVKLLGRKWILEYESGEIAIVEGDGIVGDTPTLQPGGTFSYNSHHVTAHNAKVKGTFYGIDALKTPIHVTVPAFEMIIPEEN